jgi:hypothetical protein
MIKNPNRVNLQEHPSYEMFSHDFDAKIALFKERYAHAQSLVPGEHLLYRLDPQTAPSQDAVSDFTAARFGGLPDLRRFFHAHGYRDKTDEKRYEKEWRAYMLSPMDPNRPPQPEPTKVNLPPIAEWVEKMWPRCNCCHKPMEFIGQLELTDWQVAILQATYFLPEEMEFKSWVKEAAYTGAANKRMVEHVSCYRTWMYFFKCEYRHWEEPNSDARVMIAMVQTNPRDNEPDIPAWTDEQFHAAVAAFTSEHQIQEIDPLLVTDYALKFDVEEHTGWELRKAHPEVFDSDCNFQLFGEARSQQDPKRYLCTNSYGGPHYQAPLLSWDDNENDITHQMYGCPRCVGIEHTIWGKMDSSNT